MIETLVALSLMGIALLLTLSLIFQEPRTRRRLAAHQHAYQAMEVTLEAIRAGRQVPRERDQVDLDSLYQPDETPAENLEVWTETEEASGSGELHRLTLTAIYQVERRRFVRHLDTLIWDPE